MFTPFSFLHHTAGQVLIYEDRLERQDSYIKIDKTVMRTLIARPIVLMSISYCLKVT